MAAVGTCGLVCHRFAMRALLIFAEALHTHRPDLDIYNYKYQVIRTTIRALLSAVSPDGCLPALNDASRTMGIHDDGMLIAAAVYNVRYGDEPAVHALARQQGQVWVHPAALGLAAAADALPSDAPPFWPSVELNEGPAGDKGAQGFLRAKAADGDITQVVMIYGQHGMDHGHFDTLGITLFNRGAEVLREYGFARWLNVEPKFGGRYLPENLSWARQTQTSAPVDYNRTQWSALGDSNGYQHLMGVTRSTVSEPGSVTWLQGQRFNTWLSAASEGGLLFAQLGVNDAAFNLRRDTTMILRQRGRNHLFALAFETHGYFDESSERCHGARGTLTQIRVIGHDDQGSVVELLGRTLHLRLMVSNVAGVTPATVHAVSIAGTTYRWTGGYACVAVS